VFFFTKSSLYLFDDRSAIFRMTCIEDIIWKEFQDVPCLLDMDFMHPELYDLFMSDLFLLQAASPNPKNTKSTKERYDTVKYMLNPPGMEEII